MSLSSTVNEYGFLKETTTKFWESCALESLSLCQTSELKPWLLKLHQSRIQQTLTSLNLENSEIQDKRILFAFLKDLPKLKTLNLRGMNRLTDKMRVRLDKQDPSKTVTKTLVGFIDYDLTALKGSSSTLSSLQNLYLGGWFPKRASMGQGLDLREARIAGDTDLTPDHPDVRGLPSRINLFWAEEETFRSKEDPSKTLNCKEAWAAFRAEKTHALPAVKPDSQPNTSEKTDG